MQAIKNQRDPHRGERQHEGLGTVIGLDEGRIERHADELVRGIVGEMLNDLLDAEADAVCNVPKYSPLAGPD